MNQAHPTTIALEAAEISNRSRASWSTRDLPLSFWAAWPWWLPPALVSLLLVLYFVDPFIGDWDGLDYTMLALAGYPSSMALGRNLFIFGNHVLYELAHALFDVQPEHGYLIFKYAVVAQAPLAVITCWELAREFTGSLQSATLAALFLVFSPVFVLYGGQVMTDVPSVLFIAAAMIIHWRGVKQYRPWMVVAGAVVLGLGVNLRETVGFYAPWLMLAPFVGGWRPRRREIYYVILSLFVFLLISLGWFGYWFISDAHYRFIWFGWRESMRQETARHPVTVLNLWPFLMYFFVSAPLVFLSFPFAMNREWRQRKLSPLLLLALLGLFADGLLFLNYSTAVNWRYLLAGLPALAPLSAQYLLERLSQLLRSTKVAFVCCIVALLVLATVFSILIRPVSRQFIQRRAMSKEYRHQLQHVPPDAVMISGAQTIAVTYWKAIGLGNWKTIGTGGGWPGDKLVPEIEAYLDGGRRVFLDADPRWWMPCGWQRDEIAAIVGLKKQFSFRRITDTIYEIKRAGDRSAQDSPNLEQLLPENRPEDTRKCPPGSA
ncbi:MAG TPA: glycosyltransferase family 39 protein [Pyrinomonadaceae bacterium]|nr:glycosyltransferase family 39 protein [Pyrinomonadaceae bacterium]